MAVVRPGHIPPTHSQPVRSWYFGLLPPSLIGALAGCGSAVPASATPQPTAAARPAIPDEWTTLTTEEGDIQLVVPPDIELINAAPSSLMAQPPMREGDIPFEVMAVGPGELRPPPAEESIPQWIEQRGFLPQAAEGVTVGPTTERETILPAGRAFEITTSVQPGTPEEGRVVLYLIETEAGLALLRFVGTPAGIEERTADMDLMRRLVVFGEQPEPANSK